MKYIVFSLVALVAAAFIFLVVTRMDQPEPTPITQIEDASPRQIASFFRSYKNHLENQLNNAQCPGAAVIVVKDTTIYFAQGFGVKSLGSTDPIELNTVFRIGSLSKAFAGLLTAKMVEEGKLDWDTKVQSILPYFVLRNKEQGQMVEVQHILSHSLGFPRHAYTYKLEDLQSPREIADDFKYLYLQGNPGTYYAYQNVAFALIEDILFKTTGRPYQELLRNEIFIPAGMLDASVDFEGMDDYYNKALPHRFDKKNKVFVVDTISHKYYNASSAGGINASIVDMASWIQVLFKNRPEIASEQVINEIFHPYINTSDKDLFFNKWQGVSSSHYAMGWRFLSYKDKPLLYHGGNVNEYRSEIALDPDRKLAICALFNSSCSYSNIVVPDFFEWLELYEDMLKHL